MSIYVYDEENTNLIDEYNSLKTENIPVHSPVKCSIAQMADIALNK